MSEDVELAQKLARMRQLLQQEVGAVVFGQTQVIEEILLALFCQGHVLLVGVPGLAKTLLIKTLSSALRLTFNRVQFTPDLMPSDITGTEILEEDPVTHERHFRFVQGPVFANILLADEINRTPPKTQAALLEAMQEHQVTAAGRRYPLPEPFFVLATQNPIEQEGTYPLPEAQLDRFMFNIKIAYPTAAEEKQIINATTGGETPVVKPVLGAKELQYFQRLVRRVPLPDTALNYITALVRATRPDGEEAPAFIKEQVAWGAGPRAGQCLALAAKARSLFAGRYAVDVEDVKAVALPVLRHRIVASFSAGSMGITTDDIINRLLKGLKIK